MKVDLDRKNSSSSSSSSSMKEILEATLSEGQGDQPCPRDKATNITVTVLSEIVICNKEVARSIEHKNISILVSYVLKGRNQRK